MLIDSRQCLESHTYGTVSVNGRSLDATPFPTERRSVSDVGRYFAFEVIHIPVTLSASFEIVLTLSRSRANANSLFTWSPVTLAEELCRNVLTPSPCLSHGSLRRTSVKENLNNGSHHCLSYSRPRGCRRLQDAFDLSPVHCRNEHRPDAHASNPHADLSVNTVSGHSDSETCLAQLGLRSSAPKGAEPLA